MSFKPHAIIHLNSKDRTSGTINNPRFLLTEPIRVKQDLNKQYYIKMEDIMIARSFYEINDYNNTFIVSEEGGSDNSVTVDNGNYSINDLITVLQAALNAGTTNSNTYFLSYDTTTARLSIYFTGTSTDITINTIASGSTLNSNIGFGKSYDDISTNILVGSGNVAAGTYNVDLEPTQRLRVECNFGSNNCYSTQGKRSIAASIPMDVNRFEYKLFENESSTPIRINIAANTTELVFNVLDTDHRQIDLNGNDWSFTLIVLEYNK